MQIHLASILGGLLLWGSANAARRSYDFHFRAGHIWGTIRGDSLVANRRQNKGLWCSAMQLTAECSTVELPGIRATLSFSLYYRKLIHAMTFRREPGALARLR